MKHTKKKSDTPLTPRTFWEPLLYAAPFLLVCMVFTIWPIINVFLTSFYEGYNFIDNTYQSVGFANFKQLFSDR
ncbi:MAG: sugar ABC transporter permease, partial [Pseudoflavonifractor sp.]